MFLAATAVHCTALSAPELTERPDFILQNTSTDKPPVTGLEISLVERSRALSAPGCPEALLNRVGEGHHTQADGDPDDTGK